MKPDKIWWNKEYGTCEAIYPDGYIEPLRDDYDAKKLAEQHDMKVEG
jgi:hypothetical protein